MKSPNEVRHFLTMDDISPDELHAVIKRSRKMRAQWDEQKPRVAKQYLDGVDVVAFFEKPSLRTWLSTSIGVQRHGGTITKAEAGNTFVRQDGKPREEIRDIARTTFQYADVIAARLNSHETLEEIAEHSAVPVINLLTDREHPAQALASIAALREGIGRNLRSVNAAWVGDGSNVDVSLAKGLVKMGVRKFTNAGPKEYWIPDNEWEKIEEHARQSGTEVLQTEDPREAVFNADYVATDTFVSMGQEAENDKRVRAFDGYQVNEALLANAAQNVVVGHCLPAHRGEEISNGVLEAHANEIFGLEANFRLATFVAIARLMIDKSK